MIDPETLTVIYHETFQTYADNTVSKLRLCKIIMLYFLETTSASSLTETLATTNSTTVKQQPHSQDFRGKKPLCNDVALALVSARDNVAALASRFKMDELREYAKLKGCNKLPRNKRELSDLVVWTSCHDLICHLFLCH